MNPIEPTKLAATTADPNNPKPPATAENKFSSSYVALYPSNSMMGWNGVSVQNSADRNRQQLPSPYTNMPQFNAGRGGIPILQPFPSNFVGFGNQTSTGNDRRKTNRTPVACVVCHKAKSTCDRSRPCARCRRLGKSHLCKDRPHRKKGRPRKRLLNNTGSATAASNDSKLAKASEKKARSQAHSATSSSDPNQKSGEAFKLSDCYFGNDMPRFVQNMAKKPASAPAAAVSAASSAAARSHASNGASNGARLPEGSAGPNQSSKSAEEYTLTELQSSFAQMSQQVNYTLWEEVIGDMSSFMHDAKKYEKKFASILNKMPSVKQVMSPLFCMYLTHMSYYLHPDQWIQLQKKMAITGVLIPNGSSCKIRKFDESLVNMHNCKAIAPISRLRWCLKHPRPHMETRFSQIDNWPLATIKVNMFSTADPLTHLVYISVNEEFERIFGFRQAEMVLMSRRPFYYRLIHPKDWKKQLSLEMSTMLNRRKRFNTLVRCVCKWKEEIICLETFRYSFDEEDTLYHFTISFTPLPRYMFK